MVKKLLKTFLFSVLTLACLSQDCLNPLVLCSKEQRVIGADEFSGAVNETCLQLSNSVYFEFTTNDNSDNPSAFEPYEVQTTISSSGCIEAGVQLPITAAVYQPVDPNAPCGALNEIATCITEDSVMTINSGTLLPNTTYIIIVGVEATTTGFSCDLSVTASGGPLEIDACCDDNIPLGLSSQLLVYGGTPDPIDSDYVWAPSTGLDDFLSSTPEATPEFTTTYTVQGTVGECMVTDQVTITIEEAITPLNVFSPNGDGINDTWKINRIENFTSALITVFDRWGQEVYKTIGYSTPWDGTNQGKELSAGTYYYTIELNSLEVISQPIVGFVLIVH